MAFRTFLEALEKRGELTTIGRPVSKRLEMAGVCKALDGQPVRFDRVMESRFRVAANVFPSKERIAQYFGIAPAELVPRMIRAIERPTRPRVAREAPCQEAEMGAVDVSRLPILQHCERDGGNYISSGVVVTRDRDHGQNVDFHRMMQIGKDKFAVRVVSDRHFDKFLRKNGKLPVAVCVGNGANVLLAAATSAALGQDELEIANTLEPLDVVRARTFDGLIPADCEFVLEGTVDLAEKADEGPFVDLTETYDIVRREPVFTVTRVTHRRDAIWHALLPGALEHKMLMGMPREPTIFREVSKVVRCLDVSVNPGGCSWLHAIVQIDKRAEDDGRKALEAAFRGHTSMKHCFVVDADIDPYDPLSVEWAMATRFQGDEDIVAVGRQPGSSLDPSGDPATKMTYKMGFDLTKPLVAKGKNFEKAAFPAVNLRDYVGA